jgi:diguanylate cyclase (GGDEF)-like protein
MSNTMPPPGRTEPRLRRRSTFEHAVRAKRAGRRGFAEPPAPEQHPSVHLSVLGFVVFVCVIIVAMTGRQIWSGHAADVRVSQQQTTNLARSLAQQATDSFLVVDLALLELTERAESEGTARPARRRLSAVLGSQLHQLPMIHNLLVISSRGEVLVNALSLKTANVSDREYFRYHRAHAERQTHFGPAVRSKMDGTWILTASRRLNHRDGSFAGVTLATVQVQYFAHLYDGVNIGKLGIIDLTLANGTILIRKPADGSIGKSLAKSIFFRKLALQPHGTYESRSVIDGISRFFAYSRVDRYPLLVVVGLAQDEVLAEWRWESLVNVGEVAVVLGLLLLLGSYLLRQIRQREAAERELERLALVDALTGLGNRRRFDDVLELEWRRAVRARSAFAFLMIDVDEFKSYNDHYGHRAGDRALKTIAACIAATVTRSEDLAARYGGEEFAILLPSTDALGAYRVAETIRTAVMALRIAHPQSPYGIVTVSIGAAGARPERGTRPGDIVDAADAALYDAKRRGRNRTEVELELIPTVA